MNFSIMIVTENVMCRMRFSALQPSQLQIEHSKGFSFFSFCRNLSEARVCSPFLATMPPVPSVPTLVIILVSYHTFPISMRLSSLENALLFVFYPLYMAHLYSFLTSSPEVSSVESWWPSRLSF